MLPEHETYYIGEQDLQQRAKFLKWSTEYLRGLREKHQSVGKLLSIKLGAVVIMKSDERNRGDWPLGVVTDLYEGSDGGPAETS